VERMEGKRTSGPPSSMHRVQHPVLAAASPPYSTVAPQLRPWPLALRAQGLLISERRRELFSGEGELRYPRINERRVHAQRVPQRTGPVFFSSLRRRLVNLWSRARERGT
jgi:hypothetical protein